MRYNANDMYHLRGRAIDKRHAYKIRMTLGAFANEVMR